MAAKKNTSTLFDFKAKERSLYQNNNYSLAKTISMFEWENLPDSIPSKELEKMLQTSGYAFLYEHENTIYAFTGGLGGEPDVYGRPTEIVIANPALKLNKTLKLTEGVLICSDDLMMGLRPIFNKYNSMLVENDLSMVINSYATRMQLMISASDDKTKKAADEYLANLIKGDLGAIAESALLEGIKTHTTATQQNQIKALIEFHQYIKASMFNELGLDAAFNMKRERLNTAEVGQNDDGLYPFIDNMMKCRLEAVEAMNEFFGLDVAVGFGSIWAVKNKRLVDGVVEEETVISQQNEEEENAEETSNSRNSDSGAEVDSTETEQSEELPEQPEPVESEEPSETSAEGESEEESEEESLNESEEEPEAESDEESNEEEEDETE